MRVLLAESSNGSNASSSVCFVDDVILMSDKQILDKITPSLNKISEFYKVQTLKLAEITAPHVNCNLLFEQLRFLLSTEIWNTFGAWIKNENPKLSSGIEDNLHGYAESANRKDIQNSLYAKKAFQNKMNNFLSKGKILCFPTTVDLAPRVNEITPDFLAGAYIPRAMGVNAISSLSCAPQITCERGRATVISEYLWVSSQNGALFGS
jgi:amidase